MSEEQDHKQDAPQTKYLRTLIKSGHEGELVESGEECPLIDPLIGEAGDISKEVKEKALKLLGLIEEYFVRPGEDGAQVQELKNLAGEDDMEKLLQILEDGHETPHDNEATEVKTIIKQEISLLLATKGVKEYFFTLLKEEAKSFKQAQPTLQRVALLQRVQERIDSGITKLYLRDIRSKGKLMATTSAAIKSLEEKRIKADVEERQKTATASNKTKSWLIVQELLEYKAQLTKNGFAKTESRKHLVKEVQTEVTKGNRVFLVGSTGTGKTQLAMLVADLVNENGFEVVGWTERTTTRDIFGNREVKANGNGPESFFNPGPMMIAIEEGKIVIHDELTLGQTGSHMSVNALISQLERGDKNVQIPGLHGRQAKVKEGFGEISTGNPKDERTKKREDMDPAVLRRYVDIKVPYMPASELFKVILANIIDETGLLPLSPQEVELARKLTQAAELMQMCHDREIEKLGDSEHAESIKGIFAGRLEDVHMDKNFLDTGTLRRILKGWDLEKAKGNDFATFLNGQLRQFIEGPKFDMDKEERELARTILEVCGVWDAKVGTSGEPYILPSKIGSLFKERSSEDITEDEDEDDNPDEDPELEESIDSIVETQYASAVELLKTAGLLTTEPHPSKEKVKRLLAKNLTKDQIEAIGEMEKPTLQLVPKRTCEEYETALNKNKPMVNSQGELQEAAQVTAHMKDTFTKANTRDKAEKGKITGWRIAITEGANAPDLLPGDDTQKTLQARYDWFKNEFENKGISGIDIKSWILLMIAGMAKDPPRPIDDVQGADETWTMLNLEEISNGRVAGAAWVVYTRQVVLVEYHAGDQSVRARFRASVMVDVEENESVDSIVETQYASAVQLLKTAGLLANEPHPSKDKVKKLLAKNLTKDQLEAIEKMEKPTLQLVPKRSCEEYETALNKNKPMQGQQDANVTDHMKEAFTKANTRDKAKPGKITGWRIAITEGANAPALLPGDDDKQTLQKRCDWFKEEFESKGISGIDIKSYILLMIAGLAKDPARPIDDINGEDETWTMLNLEEIFDSRVAGAYSNDGHRCRVGLVGADADRQDVSARFRASVMVDVEEKESIDSIVETQYASAVQLLKTAGLLSNEPHPPKDKVKKLLAKNLTKDQLEAIEKMEKPTLQLVPKRTCEEYETALNKNKPMQGQQDANVTAHMKAAFIKANARDNAQPSKITGWRIAITEGANAPALLPGDDDQQTPQKRCDWFKTEFESKGISGIDIKSYILLMIAGMAQDPPLPIDDINGEDETWTMLNLEEIFDSRVASAYWDVHDRQVNLVELHADFQYSFARFRASVMVDVL